MLIKCLKIYQSRQGCIHFAPPWTKPHLVYSRCLLSNCWLRNKTITSSYRAPAPTMCKANQQLVQSTYYVQRQPPAHIEHLLCAKPISSSYRVPTMCKANHQLVQSTSYVQSQSPARIEHLLCAKSMHFLLPVSFFKLSANLCPQNPSVLDEWGWLVLGI